MPKIKDIGRWRTEISLAEKFRDEEFGTFTKDRVTKAGENILYYENGWSEGFFDPEHDTSSTLNLFHALAKNVLPAIEFKNPTVNALPKRKADTESAFFAKGIMNYFYKEIGAEKDNKRAIWDAYILGQGIVKVGYSTQFGVDVTPSSEKKKKTAKDRRDEVLEQIGLKKPKEEEVIFPEKDLEILAERPYVQWISPFNYLRDPRSTGLDDAMWVCHVADKTVADIKANPKFKNTSKLEGIRTEIPSRTGIGVPETDLEEFEIVKLYEVHYRQKDGFYLLYIVKDGSEFRELYHEKSVYNLSDWQFDEIDFSGHGHLTYKKSEMSKIKNLQDRFTATIDAILEQVDRFPPKIAVDETGVSEEAKRTIEDGDIGAVIYTNRNPSEVIREVGLTQFKSYLQALNSEIINIVTIQTGLTKSQLLGVSAGETATEATIAQGGQTLRQSDMVEELRRFHDSQATKLWGVIKQFVELEELEIITGENGINPETGQPLFSWLPEITIDVAEKLEKSNLRFQMEVGSSQRLDVGVVRKSIENLISILARTDVIALMQQQGKKVDLAEILKMWLQQSPEIFRDVSKIIQDVNQQTPGLIPQDIVNQALGGGQGGMTAGSDANAQRALEAAPAPSAQQNLSEVSQI